MASLLQRQSSYRSTYEHSSLSQPAAECSRSIQYQFRTLPRQRPNNNQVVPAAPVALSYDPSNARRQLVSNTVADYLKSLNSMTRSIVLEKEFVEEKHAGEWPTMDETEQEEVVDEHFMPINVHAHYGTLPRSRPASRASSHGDPEQARHHDEAVSRNRPRKSSVSDQPTPEPASPPPQHPSTPPTYFIPPTHNRLHKNQLSYRSTALRKVMNMPPAHSEMNTAAAHQSDKRDSGLGSDGESPRTSDEDLNNTLAFRRNHLRSYSLRHGKCAPRNSNSLSRSSTRRNRLTSSDTHSSSSFSKNPHQYDSRYDEEVDLPDESLLLDHVPSHQPEPVGSPTPPKPSRYSSRIRRSTRMQPRVLADEFSNEDVEENGEVMVPKLLSRVASNDSASTVNNTDAILPMFHHLPAVMLPHLRRAQSEDSIDTDIDSIAPSNMSNLSRSTGILTEDEIQSDATTVRTCLTPDSIIYATSPSTTPTHSPNKKGLVRSRPQSLRGGSFYETSTSEFAKRRAQFKPNMLRNQLSFQNSPAHTRQSTPSFSRQSTPSLSSPAPSDTPRDQFLKPFVKSPLSMKQRCGSAGESVTTSEHLASPEFLSQLSSPPHTPVVKSIIRGNHLHVRSESHDQKRESGYISSSSESFAFSGRR